ncbi:hypothetical protein HGG76_27390 [Ochrobactrum tritici]|uniref:Uncharacterized protein n=1 Tax=Brucella tritici TaxID=94626 RepID=A0A7X6JE78_9HYPH|nr:hypothetical protein [Brucella tritici]
MENKEVVIELHSILCEIDNLALKAKALVGDRISRDEMSWVEDIRDALFSSLIPHCIARLVSLKSGRRRK